MKAPANIKEMASTEIMETYCPRGEAIDGVSVEQDYQREITIVKFDDATVEIHNNTVIVK